MHSYITLINKAYLKNYQGISKACWAGITINFIESILIGIYYFLSLYFVNELHFNVSTSGLILSCYGAGAVLGGIFGGQLSDKFSPLIIMIVSLLFQALVYCGLIAFTSQPQLMLMIGLLGLSVYSFLTANHVWILNRCNHNEAEKLKVINILSMISNLGLGVAALIISNISHGYHTVFSIAAIVVIIMAMLLPTLDKEKNSVHKDQSNVVIDKSTPVDVSSNKATVIAVLFSVLLVGSIVTQLGSTYSIYIHSIFPHMQRQGFSTLFALNTFLVVMLSAPLGNLFKHKNKMSMVGIGGLLVGSGMGMLAFCYSFYFAIFACVIYTIGEIIFFSMAQLICYQRAKPGKKGKSVGLYRTTYALARVAGPITGGLIYTHLGSSMLWYCCAFAGLSCYLVCHTVNSASHQY